MKKRNLFFILLLALLAPWAANAQTSLWSEDFEGGSMPAGWTTDGSGSWSVGVGDYSTSTGAGHGSYNAKITHGSTGDVTKLITPEIDLSSVTSAMLSFMHVQRSWAGDYDYLKVYYRTSSSEAWTQLVAYTSAISSWTTEEEIVLPTTTATYQLAFEYTDNYGYGVGLDQIVISAPSSCPKPATLAVAANGQSATLTWASDASSFHVAYSADGTANPDDLTYTTVTTNSYTKDNLALDADHYFWVRANCSGTDQSDWAGPVSVHIGYCVPAPTSVDNNGISNVTFGIDDYVVNNETPTATYADYSNLVGTVRAGVEATIAITFKTGYTYNTYVWVDLDNSLSFDADEVVCYGESTSSNPTTLTLNFTIPADQTLGDFRLRIGSADSGLGSDPTAANPCYTGTYGCFQDYTLRVLEAPSCLPPTGLTVSDVTAHTANISWTSDGNAWLISYSNDNFATEQYVEVTENPYTLTGLAPETAYQVRVQNNCGGGTYSIFTNPVSFTTTVACPAPTGLAAALTPGNGSVATLSWTSDASAWVVAYKTADATDFTEVNVTENPYTLTSLTPETTYNAKVKAVCGGEDGESSWSNTITFTPTDTYQLTVNDGTTTNAYVPFYGFYADSDANSQFIIPADGLSDMAWGTIQKLTFYSSAASAVWNGAVFDIYFSEVDYTTFETAALIDWTALSEKVYTGSVSVENGKMELTLTSPYTYMGGNLLIGFDETSNSSNYPSASWYGATQTNNTAVYKYSSNSAVLTSFLPKVTFNYEPGEEPSCFKPTGLAVEYTGGTEAIVSWTSDASAWNMRVNGVDVNGVITNPYTLTGLELATTYEVEVQANCGDATSEWATTSFTTDLCMPENMCAITIEVTDAYGDGGGQIQVVDVLTNEVLGTYTNSSSSTTYTLAVCDGRELNFVFASTDNWSYENGWVITDINNEIISEHVGCSSSGSCDAPTNGVIANYTMSCTVTTCRRPTDLAASEVGPHSAVLSWTENGEATAWVVEVIDMDGGQITNWDANTNPFTIPGLAPETNYKVRVRPVCSDFDDKWSESLTFTTDVACPKPTNLNVTAYTTSADVAWEGFADAYDLEWALLPATESKDPYNDGNWYYYDNGTYVGSVGLGGGEFHWGVMFPAGTYEGTLVSKVKAYDINAMVGTLAIYNDGETAPANQISIQDVEFTGAGDWVEFTTNAIIDPSKNVWIVFDAVDGAAYPIGTSNDDNGDANGRWVEIGGTWYDMNSVGVTGRANMLRAYIEEGFNPEELDWNPVSGITSPYTIEGLQPDTTYVVRVKAVCGGDDGESAWTMTTFTTHSACDMPNTFSAEVEATSATLSWVGYQESYNLRYRRTPYAVTTYFSEDFDEGLPATWTTIDNDTTTVGNWIALSEIHNVYTYYTSPLTGWAHSGADAVASASYVNGEGSVATDNYLVTPQVTFNGKLRFYATSEYEDPDTYEVLLSTTGNSISDFNVTLQAMGPATYGAWDEVIIDLSDYAGQQGYIAIHHVATDKYWLVIDDFGMYDFVYEDWTNVTATENTYTATGLTPEAEYEWQVQGVNASCGELEWTEIQYFTTLEQTNVTQTIALATGINWVSFYVDINLDALKAALVEAMPVNGVAIAAQNGGRTAYNGSRWRGALNSLNLSQMYKITVPEACEITVEGMPIDPTMDTITIRGGLNWIAFPFMENMTIANAFAGFATNGDQVKSMNDGQTAYNGNRWRGALNTLVPGKGYIYNSASTEERTFVFPTSSKAFKLYSSSSFSSSFDKTFNKPANAKLEKKSQDSQQSIAIKVFKSNKNSKSIKK